MDDVYDSETVSAERRIFFILKIAFFFLDSFPCGFKKCGLVLAEISLLSVAFAALSLWPR